MANRYSCVRLITCVTNRVTYVNQMLSKALIVLLLVTVMLPVSGQNRELEDDAEPEIIPAALYNQNEMTQFLRKLNMVEPKEAVEMLESFTRNFGLDLDARPESPRDIYEVKIGERRFVPDAGVDRELREIIGRKNPDDYVVAYMQLEQMASLRDYIFLSQLGVRGLFKNHWIGHSTFIIAFPAGIFERLVAIPQRRWLGYFSLDEKINIEYERIPTALVSPVDTDRNEYREYFTNARIEVRQFDETLQKYLVNIQPQQAEQLAEQWWVRSIEFVRPTELEQGIADDDLPKKYLAQDSRIMSSAGRTWLLRSGAGIRVGVLDGAPDSSHPDFPAGTFLAGSNTGANAHGTHVSGIIAARNSGTIVISGVNGAQGMAPRATLFTVDNGAFNYVEAFNRFRNNNVRLSNHSWGFCANATCTINDFSYNFFTEDFDRYIANEDFIIVKSAGNSGPGAGTITNPGTAKNIITVGAIHYVTDDDRNDRVIGEVTGYSSRGPTLGRLKPEIVAPGGQGFDNYGYFKYGVVSLNAEGNNGLNIWPEGDDNYLRMSGTSMAAPHVTGAGALILEWSNMSSEAFKARLIGTTIPIKAGGTNPRAGYANTSAGYGLLNAYNAAGLKWGDESETLKWTHGTVSFGGWFSNNDQELTAFFVPTNVERLIFVLAYNDVPGGGGDLVHDLQLSVSGPGVSNRTPTLPTGVTNKSPLQKLVVENPQSGPWTATVSFLNPNIWSAQDYSLFVYAIYKTPELDITSISHPGTVNGGETFTASMTIENIGGWIAAGVTAWVQGEGFSGDVDLTKNVRNLKFQGDNVVVEFELTAPQHTFGALIHPRRVDFCTDAVNREIEVVCTGVNINIQPPWLISFILDNRYLFIDSISKLNITAFIQDANGKAVPDRTMVAFTTTKGSFDRSTFITQPTVDGKSTVSLTASDTRGVGVITAFLEENKDIGSLTKVYFTPEGIGIREFAEATVTGSGAFDASDVTGGNMYLEAVGSRTITAATYTGNPVGRPGVNVVSNFIDIHIDRVDDIKQMELEFCEDNFLTDRTGWREDYILHYWEGSRWVAASSQKFDGERCAIVTMTEDTSPAVYELTGMVFAALTSERPATDFLAELIISDRNNNTQTLTFGTAPDATDGFDDQYDELAPPPPPAGAFDARFRSGNQDYLKFIRPTTKGSTTWLTLFQFSDRGDPITISWDPKLFEGVEGDFRLLDTFGRDLVNVNMRETASYTVSNTNINQLYIRHTLHQTSRVQYTTGWNMIGLPVEVDNPHYRTLFNDAMANTLWGFRGQRFYSADNLEYGNGYWLRFAASGMVDIPGRPIDELKLSLNRGWNLIAGTACPVAMPDVIDPDGIIVPNTLFKWDSGYTQTDIIHPGRGYWVYTNAEGSIGLACIERTAGERVLAKETSTRDRIGLSGYHRLEFASSTGNSRDLFFGARLDEGTSYDSFRLPPVPPQGAFDIRFTGDTYMTKEFGGEILIQAAEEHFPLTLKIEVPDDRTFVLTEFQGETIITEHMLDYQSELMLVNSEVDRLQLREYSATAEVPLQYSLSQNYPNPFNPVTTIQYQIPEQVSVRLEIYNMLGQQVRSLVNDVQEAGYYSVTWNGHNNTGQEVSSGLYLYRIQAGEFVETRKLILMK